MRDETLCGALEGSPLRTLRAISERVELSPGQALCREGDPVENVWTVVRGVIRAVNLLPDGRRQIGRFFFPGSFLGLGLGEFYPYGAEAIGSVSACRLKRDALGSLKRGHPELDRRLLEIADADLAAAQRRLVLLGRGTAREKVAAFLLEMARRGTTGAAVELPMSRTDVADHLGLTLETVSRTFSRLAREGVLRAEGLHRVRLIDRAGLEAAAYKA